MVRRDSQGRPAETERLVRFLRVAAAGWVLFTLRYVAYGRWTAAKLNAACALVHVVILVSVERARSRTDAHRETSARPDLRPLAVSPHATAFATTAGLVALAMSSGQARSTSVWFLLIVPLAMAYTASARAAAAWAALVVATVVGISAVQIYYPLTPEFVATPREVTIAQVLIIALATAFAYVARSSFDEQVRAVSARERVILGQRETLEAQASSLAVALDAAHAANRARSEFASTMSHEVRTPLHGVIASVDLLSEQDLPAAKRGLLTTIRASASALLALVNDVLDFAKVDAGRLLVASAPFDLRASVRDVREVFLPEAARRAVDLVTRVDERVPARVLGDEPRVRQVLLNLVANAVKHTERGSVTIHVALAPHEGVADVGAVSLKVDVVDTGIGIPENALEGLFEPFSQIDPVDGQRRDGTGLGLAIARRIARAMAGDVTATSTVGVGSTFTFTLVVGGEGAAANVDRDSRARALRGDAGRDDPNVAPPKRILVADDNVTNLDLITRMLEVLGHDVAKVEDGEAALRLLRATPFDIALLDLQMPLRDGLSVAREIARSHGDRPRLVAVTATATRETRLACVEAGFDAFLAKPFTLEDLEAEVGTSRGAPTSFTSPVADAPPSQDDLDIATLSSLQTLCRAGRQDFAELVATYVSSANTVIEAMRDARAPLVREVLSDGAHKLRSSAGMMGVRHVQKLAGEIEDGVKVALPDARLRALVDEMLEAHARGTQKLLAFVG